MRAAVHLSLAALSAGLLVCCSLAVNFNGLEGAAGDGGASSDGPTPSDGAAGIVDGRAGMDAGALDGGHGTRCAPSSPFGPLVPITSINTTDDETGARLTPDELSIYFASTRDSSFDLFRASRTSLSAPFGTAVKIASLSGPQADRSPSVKADEQVLMFDSDREGGAGGRDLYLGVRSSVSTSFGAIFNLGALNTSGDDSRPYMLPSGLVAYFESDTSGGGDIYRASRTSLADSFGTPVLVSQVNTSSAEDGYPIASEDESVVYFGTTRSGGAGGWDIMVSTRSSPGGTLSAPVRVSELATADDDIPTWISPDLCRLYVMRAPPSGTYDILVATRTP